MQNSDSGFEALVKALLEKDFFEPLTAIAEEFHEAIGSSSVAQRLAHDRQLRWYNVDMTTQEKHDAGILEDQMNRPGMFQGAITYRVRSDDIREEAWVKKLIEAASGTTLVICGYLHFEPLVQKLRARGHTVDKRVYLETVPTIKSIPENAQRNWLTLAIRRLFSRLALPQLIPLNLSRSRFRKLRHKLNPLRTLVRCEFGSEKLFDFLADL